MLFWKSSQQQFLKEFKNDQRFYCNRVVIDYFPPYRHFNARYEASQGGIVAEPIILLAIVLPYTIEVFRWQRPGAVEMIEQATRSLDPVFEELYKDMRRDVDRSLWNWRI